VARGTPRRRIRNQRPSADLNQQPGHPGEPGGHSQSATTAQGDLSHTRPSRATDSLTEGDLIIGKDGKSAIGTLVERATRFCLLLHLPATPDGVTHSAVQVRDAMITTMQALPTALRRSLTWDQGIEMARHGEISVALDLPVYFCDPHSPGQRGSNENTNGLLRQYFPKGTDLSGHTPTHLAAVAAELNARPRQTLGWDSPAEAMARLLSRPVTTGVATTP
jgi:transposase, IS30 family